MLLFRLETLTPRCFDTLLDLGDTRKLAKRAAPLIHDTLVEMVTLTFEAEGIPSWQALAELTVIQRQMLGYPAGPILQRTGELLRSMSDPQHAAHIWRVEYGRSTSVFIFGSSLEKAVPLGLGDPETNLPARPMFPEPRVLHPELEGAIVDAGTAI